MRKIILPLVVIAASGAYVWSQQGRIATENTLGHDTALDAATVPADSAPSVAPPKVGSVAAPAEPPSAARTSEATPMAPIPALPRPASAEEAAEPEEATEPAALPTPADTSPVVATPTQTNPPAPVLPFRRGVLPAQSQADNAVTTAAPTPLPRPARAAAPAAEVTLAAASVPASAPVGQFKDGSYRGATADAYYGLVQVQASVQGGRLASIKILQYPNDRRTSRYINSQALPMLKQEAIQAQTAQVDFISGATLTSNAFVQSLSSALDQAQSGSTI